MRIVWRGGLVSECSVRLPVSTRRRSDIERSIVARIEQLAEEGLRDEALAERLNQEGYFPCRGPAFTRQIVLKLRCRYGIRVGLGRLCRGDRPKGYTITDMARLLRVDPGWIYRGLSQGRIRMEKDVHFGCYLFPHTRNAVQKMKQLRNGVVCHVSFLKEHCDG
jgi:hypothetical protein